MSAGVLLLWLAAAAVDYELAPAPGNRLTLEVFKTGLMRGKKHVFEFERYRGSLVYDAATPEAARVQLVMEAAAVVLKDTWLSPKDFQKVQRYALEEMLDAARRPEIRFSSSAVRAAGPGRFEVEGNLTIRGAAKPVVVQVTRTAPRCFEGSARVRMTDYGLKPPAAGLGTVGTRDEMAFSFTLCAESAAPRP